ncbi:MAG: hypothetical protein IPM17_01925 [Verrucomicrobia bacterium]|jgi:hypothetical protein|nr:hypothetical protein [Verrucomicrobiota bacterium]
MRINLSQLERALLSAAKRVPPDERVPYAFEQRVMARLRERPAADSWAEWAAALWRAAVPCLGVAVALGVWAMGPGGLRGNEFSPDSDLETALYSVVDTTTESW